MRVRRSVVDHFPAVSSRCSGGTIAWCRMLREMANAFERYRTWSIQRRAERPDPEVASLVTEKIPIRFLQRMDQSAVRHRDELERGFRQPQRQYGRTLARVGASCRRFVLESARGPVEAASDVPRTVLEHSRRPVISTRKARAASLRPLLSGRVPDSPSSLLGALRDALDGRSGVDRERGAPGEPCSA